MIQKTNKFIKRPHAVITYAEWTVYLHSSQTCTGIYISTVLYDAFKCKIVKRCATAHIILWTLWRKVFVKGIVKLCMALHLSRYYIMVEIFFANQSEAKFLCLPLKSCQNVSGINHFTLRRENMILLRQLSFFFLVKVHWLISLRDKLARISVVKA